MEVSWNPPVISPARGGLSELRHLAQQSAAGRGAQGPAAPARCLGDLWEASLGGGRGAWVGPNVIWGWVKTYYYHF